MPRKKPEAMWKPHSVGDVIAERDFVLTGRAGRKARLRVRFGKPVRNPHGSPREPWWCPVEVKGAALDSFRPIAGIDSLQALILALELASRVLPDEAERKGFRMTWLGDSERLVLARHALSREVENGVLTLFGILRDVAATLSASDKEQRRATEALRRIVRPTQLGGASRRVRKRTR